MKTSSAAAYAVNIADRIKNQVRRSERQQVNSSVLLRKRFRNQNDSDRYGIYSSSGAFVDDFDTSALYSLNVVTPTVRTNASAMITANVKIDIQPRFTKDSKSQMAAEVARAIIEQKDREQWTTLVEEYIAQEQQLGPGVFVRTKYNPHLKRRHSLPQWEDIDVEMPGVAICSQCGMESHVSGELDEQVACDACGGLAVVDKMPENIAVPVPTEHAEFSTGDTQTEVRPFFEFRVDDENTQGGNLAHARWFEHHYLASLDELQLEYPESADQIEGQTFEWSYPIRWQQTLKRNRRTPQDFAAESVVEQREVRDIFVTPSMYLNVKMDSDFSLKDKEGKIRFEVKKDRTFADAIFEGEPFEEPPVLCMRVIGTSLIDIFPCDFREEFGYATFFANPSTFWGLFLTDLTILQDIINTVLTIQMYHIRRNAITSIVYNRSSFDPEAFEEDLIPTKEDIPPDIPIGQQFGIIPALQLSGEPMQMLGTIMEMKSDITLTTPALMGQAAPNEPYAAQLLQKQSSLGLLSPAEISKAIVKVGWAKQQLKFVQAYMTDEDAESFLKLNSEWNEDYITAFNECDLMSDLIIDYVQGSEQPTSLVEREVRLNKVFSDLVNLAGVAPQLVKPQMLNELFAEMVQASGADIDFNNNENNQKLAEGRFDQLSAMVEMSPIRTDDPQVNMLLAQQITAQPQFQPFPRENFDVLVEFFTDRAVNELSKDDPNYLLVTCLNALIKLEVAAQTGEMQEMTAQQMAAQMPMLEMQQQQEQQAAQEAAAQQDQQLQLEAGKQQVEADKVQSDQTHQMRMKTLDLADKERDREHQKEMAKGQKAGVSK